MSWRLPPKFRNVFHKLSLRLEQRDDREEPEAVAYLRPILAEKARTLSEWIWPGLPRMDDHIPRWLSRPGRGERRPVGPRRRGGRGPFLSPEPPPRRPRSLAG